MDQEWVNRYLKHNWNKRHDKNNHSEQQAGRRAESCQLKRVSQGSFVCQLWSMNSCVVYTSVFSLELLGLSRADISSVSYLRAVLRTCISIDWLILLWSAALSIWLSVICERKVGEERVKENHRTRNLWCLRGRWFLPLSCS